MKIVQFHQTALSRQVGEAVQIQRRGIVLNSKSEYNRCSIARLSLEQDENKTWEQEDRGCEEDLNMDWTSKLLEKRDSTDSERDHQPGRAGRGREKRKRARKARKGGMN